MYYFDMYIVIPRFLYWIQIGNFKTVKLQTPSKSYIQELNDLNQVIYKDWLTNRHNKNLS
jgi:hypothetical protein